MSTRQRALSHLHSRMPSKLTPNATLKKARSSQYCSNTPLQAAPTPLNLPCQVPTARQALTKVACEGGREQDANPGHVGKGQTRLFTCQVQRSGIKEAGRVPLGLRVLRVIASLLSQNRLYVHPNTPLPAVWAEPSQILDT